MSCVAYQLYNRLFRILKMKMKMAKSKEITYTLTKRKVETRDLSSNEDSQGSFHESKSTAISSQVSLARSLDHALPEPADSLNFYPITKAKSKILQQRISKTTPDDLGKIVSSLLPNLPEMMVDLYGNYICQTLFHTCSADQRLLILMALRGSLVHIAEHVRGTHALQNLISMVNLKEEENVYKNEFKDRIVRMSKDPNASHVVQKLAESLGNKYFISREILGNIRELAMDKYGVCVVKKFCNDPEVMNEVLSETLILVQHPYGNYAVQSVLEMWKEEVAFPFISCIQGRTVQLCLQKYSSNVIETGIRIEDIRGFIVKEVLCQERIKELLENQYGSYVLRTLSVECNTCEKMLILSIVEQIFKDVYSQKLQPLWEEIINNLNS